MHQHCWVWLQRKPKLLSLYKVTPRPLLVLQRDVGNFWLASEDFRSPKNDLGGQDMAQVTRLNWLSHLTSPSKAGPEHYQKWPSAKGNCGQSIRLPSRERKDFRLISKEGDRSLWDSTMSGCRN